MLMLMEKSARDMKYPSNEAILSIEFLNEKYVFLNSSLIMKGTHNVHVVPENDAKNVLKDKIITNRNNVPIYPRCM